MLHMWLTFSDRKCEDAFVQWRYTQTHVDSVVFALALIVGPSRMFAWRSDNAVFTFLHHTWMIMSSCIFSGTCLFMIQRHPSQYRKHRLAIITIARLAIVSGNALVSLITDPFAIWVDPALVLSRIVNHTPVTALFSTALLGLPFTWHFVIQLIGTVVSSIWVQTLCAASHESYSIASSVNRIGAGAEWVVTKIAVMGLPLDQSSGTGKYSCWIVGWFFHILVGFAIPTALSYALELSSRLDYLRRSMDQEDKEMLEVTKFGRLVLVGLTFTIGTQVLWVLLKGFQYPVQQC